MAKKTFATPEEYLASLPEEHRTLISAVRKLILKHLPKGYVESIGYSMISYEVPLKRYPITYNKQPLMYAALGAHKNHCAIYMMCVYGSAVAKGKLVAAFKKAGKKLDMGKSCIRFKKLDDLALDAIADAIGSVPMEKFIEFCEKARSGAVKGTC
jgi:hypothetical protein